ncbi:hypothetical protein EXIGLDRAFT_832041 [Exidia glandulosa HHB12029]|uniref:Uncharacterized protein n=1 Tax=Exidia glandulosa HHB12029 TaxID=1314781 RepID=A0A165M196_EXIGL|nr:hypothetical protein EXIGLDRAFT_832041 [Exidia glandulosa HHB12029]
MTLALAPARRASTSNRTGTSTTEVKPRRWHVSRTVRPSLSLDQERLHRSSWGEEVSSRRNILILALRSLCETAASRRAPVRSLERTRVEHTNSGLCVPQMVQFGQHPSLPAHSLPSTTTPCGIKSPIGDLSYAYASRNDARA